MSSTGETGQVTADTRRDPAMKALFRMSRTAGVGLQDYAAVNTLAVSGLLLGVASFLAVIVGDSLAILIVPVVAAVVSIVALRQVIRSNGTQTGQYLAIGGLLLAVAFAAVNIVGHLRVSSREAQYKQELHDFIPKLLSSATTQGANDAYLMFSDRFRERVTLETFQRQMQPRMQGMLDHRPIQKVEVGDLVVFETDENGNVSAQALLRFSGETRWPDGRLLVVDEPVLMRKPAGQDWRIETMTGWFGDTTKPVAAPVR